MSLPNLPAGDKFRREVRTEWGGINLNENAGDGELIEAVNMSSREYPLLSTAHLSKASAESEMRNLYSYCGQLGFEYQAGPSIAVDGLSLYDPTRPSQLNDIGHQWTRQYATLGHRMCLFGAGFVDEAQSKQIYDFDTGALSAMESAWASASQQIVRFMDGSFAGVPATANTIYAGSDVAWSSYFSPGDAVTIAGSSKTGNNKTVIIREIDGAYLRFSENTFELSRVWELTLGATLPAGDYHFSADGKTYNFTTGELVQGTRLTWTGGSTISYVVGTPPVTNVIPVTETSSPHGNEVVFTQYHLDTGITISRTVPDLDYACTNENRVWGCKGDTIYASKLGDSLNWNVYDGISTDSWTVETGTQGDFTGCCSFQGYPIFFKENAVFRVLGDEPKNFTLRKLNIVGVKSDAYKTITEIKGKLYYLSRVGVVEWNGGDYPSVISGALGIDPGQLAGMTSTGAGTDAERYYIQLNPKQYSRETGQWLVMSGVYVYDPRYRTWHKLSLSGYDVEFAGDGAHNWMTKDYNALNIPDVYTFHAFNSNADTTTVWTVTFADSTRAFKTALTGSESKKGVLRLLIRCRLAGTMKVWIAYDGGDFEEAASLGGADGMAKGSKVVPLILRRCDFWQLRLTGTGDAVIYSISVERYGGEWQQA